jgi:glycosyltransferase involved in cell wall biosynthesis
MRICIDARPLGTVVTGLGRYASCLVRHLAAVDGHHDYVILRRPGARQPLVRQENFVEVPLAGGVFSARNLLTGTRAIGRYHVDLYHALFHFLPFGQATCRTVVTLHDLIWVKHPVRFAGSHWRRGLRAVVAKPMIRHAVTAADRVITTSESTRQQAIDHYGLPAAKITAIHLGADLPAQPGPASALPLACRHQPFLFALGNTLPHKNIPRLLQAFREVGQQHPDLLLLIAGRGDGYPQLRRLAGELGVSDRVILSPQLSESELEACYAQALLFAFPSLMEGFGLPLLEAMARGCPVLASDIPPVAEVADGCAWLVDPLDYQAMATGMRRMIDDAALRRDLSRRGRLRAAALSWRACAEQTLQLYRTVLGASDTAPRQTVS